ncbi:hypothetical protein AVEN_210255-1 [Araneus ventricosus]|uniref:Integrase catalytic domain-containing protein n=1 Tax=Araneus ventricosus TaxID=182803 RepID=A0A4Y2FWK9_ARAVE|nr:hypothetical protein AVEN_210255-1 [Araneus ventricosus]
MISDCGRSFLSNLVKDIYHLYQTSDLLTTAYHPQTNSLAERFYKILADILSMYVDVEQRNWDTILPFVTFAYNSAKQNTTGFSPFFLVHGRDIYSPLDVILPHDTENHADNYVQQLITRAEEARQLRNYTSWTLKQRISDDITRGTDQSITMLATLFGYLFQYEKLDFPKISLDSTSALTE